VDSGSFFVFIFLEERMRGRLEDWKAGDWFFEFVFFEERMGGQLGPEERD
jgi:hypothetical protein